jgi:hypothetical protein
LHLISSCPSSFLEESPCTQTVAIGRGPHFAGGLSRPAARANVIQTADELDLALLRAEVATGKAAFGTASDLMQGFTALSANAWFLRLASGVIHSPSTAKAASRQERLGDTLLPANGAGARWRRQRADASIATRDDLRSS